MPGWRCYDEVNTEGAVFLFLTKERKAVKMKRLLTVVLCATLALSLTACGSSASPSADSGGTAAAADAGNEASPGTDAPGGDVKISFMSHLYKPWNDKLT